MDTTADATQETSFGRFGRFLGSTKTGRVLVSIGILALFSVAAYAAVAGAVSYILCYRFVRHERNIGQNAPEAI